MGVDINVERGESFALDICFEDSNAAEDWTGGTIAARLARIATEVDLDNQPVIAWTNAAAGAARLTMDPVTTAGLPEGKTSFIEIIATTAGGAVERIDEIFLVAT